MNLNSLMGAVSILTSQVLPNFGSTELLQFFNNTAMYFDLSNSNLNDLNIDDTYYVSISGDEVRFVSNADGTEFITSCLNYFTLGNIVDYCLSVSNDIDSVEINFDFYSGFNYDRLSIFYTDDSGDLEVYLMEEEHDNSDSNHYVYLEFSDILSLRDYHLVIELVNVKLNSAPLLNRFQLNSNNHSNEFYLNDGDNISLSSGSFIDYFIGSYYYNLGLENGGTVPDATMYDLIYDFISNNLLRSEQDTGGLARILTDTSIVLIFITLIMLLVFVFKWCSHNILGG